MTPASAAAIWVLAAGLAVPEVARVDESSRVLGAQSAATAQNPTLTLEDVVEKAIQASPQVAAAKARLVSARARIQEVWSAVYPQISLSSSLYRYESLGGLGGISRIGDSPGSGIGGDMGSGPDGGMSSGLGSGIGSGLGSGGGLGGGIGSGPGSGLTPGLGSPMHQIQAGISVNQVIFDGMRTQAGLQLADLQERLGRVELSTAARRAAIEAATAYVQVNRATSIAMLAGQATAQALVQLERAQVRLKAGTGMKLDVLQAQTALSAFRVQESAAHNGKVRAQVALTTLLRSPVPVSLAQARLPRAEVDLGRDLPGAIANRPEVQQLDLKIAMDEAQVTVQERSAWPTAGAFGQLSWQGGGGSRYDLLGLSAQWPLFDAGKVGARVEQARAELEADRATREGLERVVEADVRRALLDRDDAKERIRLAIEGVDSAREALRLAEVRHQTGAGTMFDVSDAHQAMVRAQSDLVGAMYDEELAEIRLATALSVPLSNLGLSFDPEDRNDP